MTANRRQDPRISYQTVVAIESEGRRERGGMTRDLSRRGLLFNTTARFSQGESIELRFKPPESSELRRFKATVIRADVEAPERGAILKYRIAVGLEQAAL